MKFPWPLRYTIPGVILLLGTLLSAASFICERHIANEQVELLVNRHAHFIGNQISSVAAHFMARNDIAGLRNQISTLATDPVLRLAIVCDDRTRVLASSRLDYEDLMLEQTAIRDAGAHLKADRARTFLSPDRLTVLGVFPFPLPPAPDSMVSSGTGYLLLDYNLVHPKTQVAKAFLQRTLVSSGALALASLVGWLFFHRSVNLRIARLVQATEKIARGEPSGPIILQGSDEVARLSTAFNRMAEKITSSTNSLRAANERMTEEITERKFVEEALRNSERRFRSIWESSLEAMRLTDRRGTVLAVNDAYCRLVEQPAHELIQQPLITAFQVDDEADHLANYREQFQRRQIERHQQKRVHLRSGRGLDLEVSYSFVELERDEPLLLGIFHDSTERVAFLDKLKEAKEFSDNLINTANVLIVGLNREDQITIFNEAAEQTSEYKKADVLGWRWSELLPGQERLSATDSTAPFARRNFEAKLVTQSGQERLIKWQTNSILKRGVFAGTICFGIDITERKKEEEQRLMLERKLLDAQKLESLGVLAGGIAHDFNNLLAAILGNTNLAQMHLPSSSQVAGYLKNAERASLRAADLCRQMLAYSGKGRFSMHALDLNEVVRETLELLEVSITKKASLRVELRPELPNVHADPAQLRQVIMNLVINASEAIGENTGLIRIKTGLLTADTEYFRKACVASELPAGEYVFVEVSDSGCGMSEETQARIFEPFFTTKFTGRGLGLAAVLGIVRGHQGALKITSSVGQGSTFKFLLPAIRQPAQTTSVAPTPASQSWHGAGTILVVDDDPTVRAVTARMVEACGFDVLQAVDGLHGVEVFSEKQEYIRAVVLDMTMPKLNGQEALAEMRRIRPEVKVLMVSGFTESPASDSSASAPDLFLQKPYKPDELKSCLRDLFSEASARG